MVTQMSLQKDGQTEKPISLDKVEACQSCGNSYIIMWLKKGENYNDFYFRYCPFCGQCTDQLSGSIVM